MYEKSVLHTDGERNAKRSLALKIAGAISYIANCNYFNSSNQKNICIVGFLDGFNGN